MWLLKDSNGAQLFFFSQPSQFQKKSLKKKKTLNFFVNSINSRVELKGTSVRRVTQEAMKISGRRKNGHAHSQLTVHRRNPSVGGVPTRCGTAQRYVKPSPGEPGSRWYRRLLRGLQTIAAGCFPRRRTSKRARAPLPKHRASRRIVKK